MAGKRAVTKSLVVPAVLASALTGSLLVPAVAQAAENTPATGAASVNKLGATMADRVFNLGPATGIGALVNPSAMTVDATGTLYYVIPYVVSGEPGYKVMKLVNGVPTETGMQMVYGSYYSVMIQSTMRIAVVGSTIYVGYIQHNADGKIYYNIDNSQKHGILFSVPADTTPVGGLTSGTVYGIGQSLIFSLNQQIRAIGLKANGDYSGLSSVIAGTAGASGFAGDGAAASPSTQFSNPQGLAVDGAGNLLIADTGNNRIRQIAGIAGGTKTGLVSTIAGNGNAAYSGDGQAATDAAFNAPTAVSTDTAGNIYIADTGNSKIRVLDGYRVASTVVGSSQDPRAPLTPGVIAPNATLYNPSFVGTLADGTLIFSSGANSADTSTTGWRSAPLAGVGVGSDILPSWVGATSGSSGLLTPRGDAGGRIRYSLTMPQTLLPTLTPNANGTKWVTKNTITLMTQGKGGAPFTLTADANGNDAAHSDVAAEYWITNPITFSNVLLLHDVTVTYTDPITGKTYSAMLPNGLSFAYVRGYNQSYVGQSPNSPMSWGDFSVPALKDADGNPYVPVGTAPIIQGDWIMNVGITLKPQYS